MHVVWTIFLHILLFKVIQTITGFGKRVIYKVLWPWNPSFIWVSSEWNIFTVNEI